MKVWMGYGSEHSANLVMIGRFRSPADAEAAEHLFTKIGEWVSKETDAGSMDIGWESIHRMGDATRQFLMDLHLYSLSLSDLENFAYEHHVTVDGASLTITTDEEEVQGFLKLLIDQDAQVQVYSAHAWNADGSARSPEVEESEDAAQLE